MGLIYKRVSPSGGIYIGQTTHVKEIDRWKQHCYGALTHETYHSRLHEAIRKYGPDNFSVEILEDNIPNELLDDREIYWINYYNSYYFDNPNNYNLTKGGNQGKGYHHTDEWKLNHSKAMQGDNNPSRKYKRCWITNGQENHTIDVNDLDSYLDKGYNTGRIESQAVKDSYKRKEGVPCPMGIWMSDGVTSRRVTSEEERIKLLAEGYLENIRNYTPSDETKRKLSEKNRGSNNPRFGVKVSEEQLAKSLETKLSTGSVRRVGMYDKHTNALLKSFNSAAEADRYVQENSLCISKKQQLNGVRNCCKNIQKSAYGYVWRYIDDVEDM